MVRSQEKEDNATAAVKVADDGTSATSTAYGLCQSSNNKLLPTLAVTIFHMALSCRGEWCIHFHSTSM